MKQRFILGAMIIMAALILSACWPLAHPPETYIPGWCDQHPEECRRCQPGEQWHPGEGCGARPPAPTPTQCPGQPGGAACPDGQEAWNWAGSHSPGGCGCRPIERPTPTPSATPSTSATPTTTPTTAPVPTPSPRPEPTVQPPTPSPSGLCATGHGPNWLRPMPPPHPEPVAAPAGVPCPRYTERVGPDRDGHLGCQVTWVKAPGEQGRTPAEGARVAIGPHVQIAPPGHPNAGMVCDMDNPGRDRCCGDRWARTVCDGQLVLPDDRPWWDGAFAHPIPCGPEPTPVPTSQPTAGPGPTPTPFHPPMQPADFRLNFINGCNRLRFPRERDGQVIGQCDTTPRFIGTLKSGERWGNACDPDHYRCAKVVCDGISPEEQEAHLKTHELCAAREWITAAGTRIEQDTNGDGQPDPPAIGIEQDGENQYQHWLSAGPGSEARVRACVAVMPVVTLDGLTVPSNGSSCGEWKTVRFEAR